MRQNASMGFVLWLLLTSGVAQAENNADKVASRTLLKQGNERLDREKFDEALEKFQEAYKRFPSPKIFFCEGQALRGLNRNADALRAFQRFLGEVPDASQGHQFEARKQIAYLTKRVGQVEVRSNRTGSIIRIDGQVLGPTPLAAPVFVDPGQISLEAEWQGSKKIETVTMLAGKTIPVQMDFEIKPGQLTIHCNRNGAAVFVDEKNRGMTPLASPLSVPPGTHSVTIEWLREKKTVPLTLAEGEIVSKTIDFEKPATAVPTLTMQPQPTQPNSSASVWFHSPWVWGAASALVIGVGTTLVLVYGKSDRYPSTNMGTQRIGN